MAHCHTYIRSRGRIIELLFFDEAMNSLRLTQSTQSATTSSVSSSSRHMSKSLLTYRQDFSSVVPAH